MNDIDVSGRMSRDDFESISADLFDRLRQLLQEFLLNARTFYLLSYFAPIHSEWSLRTNFECFFLTKTIHNQSCIIHNPRLSRRKGLDF